ncbi:MAG: FIG01056709: hypothetical protein [uncultured Thiotrichaceae bacterium]|uniref:Uncharacterized protein n=1 Tax=uncultured Thiotrichaceae bacterium TaxID=298394 RepID=A0A6S6TLA4_9GAMM|nr:MAG: FIG01056709: hypothetical protein [uncultured Thiotrichaceae bacterium]
MKILLLTPPMTQLNTPYPATAYLTGFLREQGYDVAQRDLALELFLELLSKQGLEEILEIIEDNYADIDDDELPDSIYHFFADAERYLTVIDPVIRFLQGKDPSLALRISSRQFLPEGAKFKNLEDMEAVAGNIMQWAFGDLGTQDKAKYLATLFIDDLVDVIHDGVDPNFEISRYGERLASSNPQFDDLYRSLQQEPLLPERIIQQLVDQYLEEEQPDFVGITIPFPGNMLGGLQIAKHLKQIAPHIQIAMGGGYINTELRNLTEPRIFEFVDFISLDDGERPLLSLFDYLTGKCVSESLVRTFICEDNSVVFKNNSTATDFGHKDIGTPSYDGLPIDRYLSLCEMLNPMHRIWSDGRWNKLTVAHGCYWSKCSFCDISLDYIERYDEAGADILIERIENLIAETGQTGFHFVDEAAPPKVLFALAEKLIERGLIITWWGNIRFEKTFTPEKCQLLADSGCIAISGGLEVASDRLLRLMKKGVTVEQVARVTKGFTDAGILVHAYLMYGFPSQTEDETVLSLEYVRQLMLNNCFQSAYWHRFAATIHSPVGIEPDKYGITLHPPAEVEFAQNEIPYTDSVTTNHEMLGRGLKRALYNYMHGIGLEEAMQYWFEEPVREPAISPYFIESALTNAHLTPKTIPIHLKS